MTTAVWVALAAAVGAPARFVLEGWLQRRSRSPVPVGTLAVNLTGAFLLGVVSGLLDARHLAATTATALSAGLLGAFTTFSTFSFEAIRLAQESAWRPLVLYLLTTLVGGVLAAGLGLVAASLT